MWRRTRIIGAPLIVAVVLASCGAQHVPPGAAAAVSALAAAIADNNPAAECRYTAHPDPEATCLRNAHRRPWPADVRAVFRYLRPYQTTYIGTNATVYWSSDGPSESTDGTMPVVYSHGIWHVRDDFQVATLAFTGTSWVPGSGN